MTLLVTALDTAPPVETARLTDPAAIAAHLAGVGVQFEQWSAEVPLPAGATAEDVLHAYAADVDRVKAMGYTTVDVARLVRTEAVPDDEWAATAAGARSKFLAEHTHSDDEVRFFIEGSGVFYLRIDGTVHMVMCEAGDFISVPANTTHWFDMGTNPGFAAIRFFKIAEGWVGNFTGSDIASTFPTYDQLAA